MSSDIAVPPALSSTLGTTTLKQCATDVGILAIEYYAPDLCVRAADIEAFHGVQGQYTIGRGQENVTFCSDDEDAVSMAMTSFQRLMKRCGLGYDEIGRLEVGTESQVDRAKSIKTFLMSFFEEEGLHDVEGADTYNACYGGTNALFNAVSWVQSAAWNGKYAVVICSDAAVHPDPAHLSAIGASSVAMLVGPHAPFVMEPERTSFIKHAYDFYRPIGWHNNDALMDMDEATGQYEEALESCFEKFTEMMGSTDLLSVYDYVAFHCNAPYHSKRNLRTMCDWMYGTKLDKAEHQALYEKHVEPGTAISAQNVSVRFVLLLSSPDIDAHKSHPPPPGYDIHVPALRLSTLARGLGRRGPSRLACAVLQLRVGVRCKHVRHPCAGSSLASSRRT